jgi:hypothetical protein
VLEILVAHGWDINARRFGDPPFLWEVVGYSDIATWCLEHGASVTPKDLNLSSEEEVMKDKAGCRPLLEVAASQSTVAMFEVFRERGAEFGPRTLHFAAQAAINSHSYSIDKHVERMRMVKHLVGTLGLDPNALDQPRGWALGNHWGTPLCYVANSNPNWDCSEVVKYLLEQGADPDLVMEPSGRSAMDFGRGARNEHFLGIVGEWKKRKDVL